MSDRDLSAAVALLQRLEPALQQRDRALQNEIVRGLIGLRAPLGDQWQRLAHLVLANGEFRMAREAIDLFVGASGDTPLAKYHKATLLEQSGALDEAYELFRTLPEDAPDPAFNAYSRGMATLFLGDIAEARRQLERATRLRPAWGGAWLALATASDTLHDTAVAERILAAGKAMADAPPQERGPYCYAVGKIMAERGEHAAAFAAFAQGAKIVRALVGYHREYDRNNAVQALDGFTAQRIAEIAARQSEPTGRSIFVTGLARSGTTLVEQILTSHSAVSDGGEVYRLPLLAGEIGGQSYAQLDRYLSAHRLAEVARLWRHWLDERFPAPGRVVDKSLDTSRFLGMAASLLPEAPVIWLTRDPLDCAWSCFRTYFVGSLPWSYDLEEIAFHFRLEDKLLGRWRDILGERLLVVPYEQLVTEPSPWIRRILTHCGLGEEPQVFAPHENSRKVTTASLMQVRQPINRRGIGTAEPYRQFLEPFIARYYD